MKNNECLTPAAAFVCFIANMPGWPTEQSSFFHPGSQASGRHIDK